MVRMQLHLTESQDRRLRAMARKTGLSRAELIRRGIEQLLGDQSAGDPLLDLMGAAGPGPRSDAAEAHDEVLYRPEEPEPEPVPFAAEPQDRLR
jgi:hypothetical protein